MLYNRHAMTKIRLFIFFSTLIIVSIIGYVVSLYARGYRIGKDSLKLSPNGLMVIKSDPDGAQIYINGELKIATNASLTLPPATYDIIVRKEGYLTWNKRLTIKKEEVTEVTAHLFKSVPSLTALTFLGASNPAPSDDMGKIGYIVPPTDTNSGEDKSGLWVLETVDLPIGFTREPKKITDGDLTNSSWFWSPDGREILLMQSIATFLLPVSDYTPQNKRTNINNQKDTILKLWENERQIKLSSKLKKLPIDLESILERKAKTIVFSPDEDMVLYTASGSAQIPDNLIKPLPGASTQKEERTIKVDKTYVYDIKEDRNFLVDENSNELIIGGGNIDGAKRRLMWFPTSRHLILAEESKVTIMDYDGTNRQEVYGGNYISPHAYPIVTTNRILLLTNLASGATTNLYILSLK